MGSQFSPQIMISSKLPNFPISRILGSPKEFSFCVTYNDFSQIFRISQSPEYSNLPCPPKFPRGSQFFATYNDRPSLRVPQNFPGLLIFSIFIFLRISKRFFFLPQSPGPPRLPKFPISRTFQSFEVSNLLILFQVPNFPILRLRMRSPRQPSPLLPHITFFPIPRSTIVSQFLVSTELSESPEFPSLPIFPRFRELLVFRRAKRFPQIPANLRTL